MLNKQYELMRGAASWVTLGNVGLSEKSVTKQDISHDSMYEKVRKRRHYRDIKNVSGCPGLEKGCLAGRYRVSSEKMKISEN